MHNAIRQFLEFFIRRRGLALGVVLAFFIGIGISTVYRGVFSPKQRTDLTVYFKAAEMVHEGRADHIYGIETSRHWHYVYSPFLALLLEPFTQVPFEVSVTLFYLLSFLCLLATFYLAGKFAPPGGHPGWKIALAAVFCLPVFLNTLSRGQLGTVSLFAQAAVLFFYFRGWKVLAGFLLALAVALKISPLAVLFFFFLFKKEWQLILAGAISSVFLWLFYPAFTIGFEQNWQLLTIWHRLMEEGSSITAYKNYLWPELFTPFAEDNQSLYAVITRLVWPTQEIFMSRATNWVRWGAGAGGAVFLVLLFLKRRPVRSVPVPRPDRPGLLAEYSLYPMLMLIFSPVTQIHHYTALFFLLFAALLLREEPRAKKKLLTAAIWISAICLLLGFTSDLLALWGAPLWGACFLWFAVWYSLDHKPA